ncbi:cupin domain-containing protein [Poritiphilus flavus]|uniref:Cupin domain-containing protein n=1 Tax=Poritiphilus flavus TaxID=2697053 RepID=A0A6L9E8S6_9FLAO|nr:cupin domain-containing protein [Poritiphilus flavus]NAS11135.1 cupin domain-containing protein [Poritiphilus flavus]
MNRKTFITQLGGTGLAAILPVGVHASSKRSIKSSIDTKEKVVRANEGTELRIFGNPQWQKVVGADTDNQIFEWIDDLSPGSGIPPHIHTKEDEIFRVLSGQVELMVDNKSTILGEGDMAYAPKNIVHSWKVIGDQKARMWVSAFPSGMEHMFKELNDLPPGKPDFEEVVRISKTYGIKFL